MSPTPREGTGVTFIDLEFDTGTSGGALLGDIASSLVSLDELLRDLASIAAYPSSVEFRKIEIVAIEMRQSPEDQAVAVRDFGGRGESLSGHLPPHHRFRERPFAPGGELCTLEGRASSHDRAGSTTAVWSHRNPSQRRDPSEADRGEGRMKASGAISRRARRRGTRAGTAASPTTI